MPCRTIPSEILDTSSRKTIEKPILIFFRSLMVLNQTHIHWAKGTKNLSVNNIYRQWDFPQHDDRCGQMGESKETAFELLIPHEQLAEAIEPAMRHLYNPPPGSRRRMPPFFLGFLPAPFHMGHVAMRFNDDTRWNAGVASIGTEVLAASLTWQGTRHHNGVKDGGKLADIMAVGRGHDDRQRDAMAVHQQVALAAIFFPDPSDSVRQLPELRALSSWPRRYSATARRSLPTRHTPPARPAIRLRTRRRPATPKSAGEWRWRSRSARRATPSTDSPYARHTRCLEHQARILGLTPTTGFAQIGLGRVTPALRQQGFDPLPKCV